MLTLTRTSEEQIVNSPNSFVSEITYENAQGPLNIKVVDPLNVKNSNFVFRFINNRVDNTTPTPLRNLMVANTGTNRATVPYYGTIGTLNVDKVSWELKDMSNGKLYYPTDIKSFNTGDSLYQTIRVGNEFYFSDLGLSLNITQTPDPGESLNRYTDFNTFTADSIYSGPKAGSFIGASITYENGSSDWLTFLKDIDSETPFNWIASGGNITAGSEDAYFKKFDKTHIFYDPNKQYAKVLGGTWAPYPLCASYYSVTPNGGGSSSPARIYCGPGFNGNAWSQDKYFSDVHNNIKQGTTSSPDQGNTDLRKLSSTLIVLTRDKSKWSRCVVLEMQEKSQLSEGHALFFSPRKHKSVNKNGDTATTALPSNNPEDANYISTTGMGWFPGYAINLETGERLNMAFGEDSYQKENNGADMIWNPTSNLNAPYAYSMGGKHFVYVFSGNCVSSTFYKTNNADPYVWEDTLAGKPYGVGRYDGGKRMMDMMKAFFVEKVFSKATAMSGAGMAPFSAVERDIMWVSIPYPTSGFGFSKPEQMGSDVRIQINVAKPYRYGWSGVTEQTNQPYSTLNKLVSVNNPSVLTKDVSPNPKNGNFPMYSFNTNDIATLFSQSDVLKNSLDLIKVVPNPYYGSSQYEARRTDNLIRITNLPSKCTIKIFTMNGTLVRTIKRDVSGQEDIYLGATGSAGGDDIKRSKRLSYVEWDLKNQNNISVASGLYIFHIDAPGVGEKIVKWFGIMRPLDVQNY
jgi:hypothetical protein